MDLVTSDLSAWLEHLAAFLGTTLGDYIVRRGATRSTKNKGHDVFVIFVTFVAYLWDAGVVPSCLACVFAF